MALLVGAGDPGSDLWTCVGLAAMLGARAGELCALRWSGVDLAAGTVRIERSSYEAGEGCVGEKDTKTRRSRRTLSIDEPTADLLRTRWAWQLARREAVRRGGALVGDPFVLSRRSDGGGPPSPSALSHAFSALRKDVGLGDHLHLHCLRHFMVTTLLDQGVPLAVASERAGHSSTAATARVHTHAVAGRDREAAAVLGSLLPRMPQFPASPVTPPAQNGELMTTEAIGAAQFIPLELVVGRGYPHEPQPPWRRPGIARRWRTKPVKEPLELPACLDSLADQEPALLLLAQFVALPAHIRAPSRSSSVRRRAARWCRGG